MRSTTYSTHQHRHNFAVWAAAQATLRGLTSRDYLREALESTAIEGFVEEPCGKDAFDGRHRTWCNGICDHLASIGVEGATYGRAAKLVAVYLKSMVVLPDLQSDVAGYIHPPVDRIMLQNIAQDPDVNRETSRVLRNASWTQFDEEEYFDILQVLREVNGDQPLWRLEEYWDITSDRRRN